MQQIRLMSLLYWITWPTLILSAQNAQETALQKALNHLLTVIEQTGGESVTIGAVTGGQGNSGPGKQREIEAECLAIIKAGKSSLRLTSNSQYTIVGVFTNSRTNEAPDFVDQLELKLKKGEEEVTSQSLLVKEKLKLDLTRQRDLAEANGISTNIDAEDTKEGRRQLVAAFNNPATEFAGNKIRSSPNSPYAVEIRCRPDREGSKYVSRKPVPGEDQLPLVSITIGELYEVVVHNESNAEVAVALSIDGIDQFAFSDDRDASNGQPKYTHWLVAAGQPFAIQGWHVTADPERKDNLLSFKVLEYGKGKASQLPTITQGKVGVIHLAFSKTTTGQSAKGAKGASETGFGPPIQLKQEPQKRNIDPPHDFLTIRYSRP